MFLVRWDSAAFSADNMDQIIDISSQLSSRQYRPVPHFYDFLITLNNFIDFKKDDKFLSNWLQGLSEITFTRKTFK